MTAGGNVSDPVRLSNRRVFRRPLAWGGSAVFLGIALLVLSSWLLADVFDGLGATGIAQVGGAVLAFLGAGIIFSAQYRHVLWVEFGEQILIGRTFSRRVIEWEDLEALVLTEDVTVIRPLEPLLRVLPQPVGAVAKLSGAQKFGQFDLTIRRLCLRLKEGSVVLCDIRVLQWEAVVKLARSRSVPTSKDQQSLITG